MSEEQAGADAGGFRFAVTLLAALGTILYAAYTYLQTTPVNPLWYFFINGLITVGIILIIILLLYILMKGYSIEVGHQDRKNMLNERAKTIYRIIFPSFIALITWIIWLFLWIYFKHAFDLDKTWFTLMLGLPSLIIAWIVAFIVFWNFLQDWKASAIEKSKTKWEKHFRSVILLVYILGALIMVWFVVFTLVPESRVLQGHVTVDMESVYYKSNIPIPPLLHVTGPNNGLAIVLAREDANHTLNPKAELTLSPDFPFNETVSRKCLLGNTLDYGTYTVFINTTDLTEGYYELWCVRPYYEKTFSSKGFYLVNENAPPVSEELSTS